MLYFFRYLLGMVPGQEVSGARKSVPSSGGTMRAEEFLRAEDLSACLAAFWQGSAGRDSLAHPGAAIWKVHAHMYGALAALILPDFAAWLPSHSPTVAAGPGRTECSVVIARFENAGSIS